MKLRERLRRKRPARLSFIPFSGCHEKTVQNICCERGIERIRDRYVLKLRILINFKKEKEAREEEAI